MAIRNIRLDSDDILRKQSKEVKKITPSILTLLDDMLETMETYNGVGLAAPQVGILKRIVIIHIDDELLELINPVIEEQVDEQIQIEGCLSVIKRVGRVKRPMYVKVNALNRYGEEIVVEATELKAIAICHEVDHLNGILFTDKIEPEEYEGEYEEYLSS